MIDEEYMTQEQIKQVNTILATIHNTVETINTLAVTLHAAMGNLHHVIDALMSEETIIGFEPDDGGEPLN